VEERYALDAGYRCADEGAFLGLIRVELALRLHRVGGCGSGFRLLDERALVGARGLRAARAELGREQNPCEDEAGDERDDSEAGTSHRFVIDAAARVLERRISDR